MLRSWQFQDGDFATLSGARIVRIATHPDYARVSEFHPLTFAAGADREKMGYGSRAIEAVTSFYGGELFNLDDVPVEQGESFEEAARVGPVRLVT